MSTLVKKLEAWPQAEATVESCTQHHCDIASAGGYVGQEYSITFRYEVNGRHYTGEFECNRPWEVDSKFCISYDPDDPEVNTMCDRRGERWVYIILAIAAILAFVAYFWVRRQGIGY
ncbi:MAG TPA: DUF3592 domain-containing protein [Candidatus Aquilonibacter sp.]|nr:DUF3592 domain-containing protein [Candidatus Aquilonibacter sp.]